MKPRPMELREYKPSEAEAAIERLKPMLAEVTGMLTPDAAAALWLKALGHEPHCASECITVFRTQARCAHCRKVKQTTLVLDGFKGMVDGNCNLCDNCIGTIL